MDDATIHEDLRDHALYAIESIYLPWFADIVNFLACGAIPPDSHHNKGANSSMIHSTTDGMNPCSTRDAPIACIRDVFLMKKCKEF